MLRQRSSVVCVFAIAAFFCEMTHGSEAYDVAVYGGTPAGISAAIAARREGASVVLLEQTGHVGGMNTSGLNRSETEHMFRKETFGGVCEEFYQRMLQKYPRDREPVVWESHYAEREFNHMLAEAGVVVHLQKLLKRAVKRGPTIERLEMLDGSVYAAKACIDATYEGDLLAAAGVSSRIGREAAAEYGEALAGVRYLDKPVDISPYDDKGTLLFEVSEGSPPPVGSSDHRIVCYNVRLNLTNDPADRVAIEKPANYSPQRYELLARCFDKGLIKSLSQVIGFYSLPNNKRELNNFTHGLVSMGMLGQQHRWAEASYAERDKLHRAYRDHTQGLLYFLAHDPRVPRELRDEIGEYGLCRDEWADNGHWPWYLYIREARRMAGPLVLTQYDVTTARQKPDVICLGSHFIDTHHVERYAFSRTQFINEGRIWQKGQIFQLPYPAITPKQSECDNLLVPVCCSATHVAFCAIRVEPTWMKLGQCAGAAAALAVKAGKPVQQIDVQQLQKSLRLAGMILDMPEGHQ